MRRSKGAAVAAAPEASRTRTVRDGAKPGALGVPEIRPVAASRESPAGSWPLIRAKSVSPEPPLAV
ncbi:hypothetical protein BHAOGJBA_6364 [Methylobacterium hispanicum]|uniref:Uncharacterized protein n=1 Tax=Methylobacterium hispanicum TaxID=270350 RepID=A0AAV4ZZI2_9HYPH|nr:hypothetical protein BHAOGJBA_6364 [Methylobacterium hispanicum]